MASEHIEQVQSAVEHHVQVFDPFNAGIVHAPVTEFVNTHTAVSAHAGGGTEAGHLVAFVLMGLIAAFPFYFAFFRLLTAKGERVRGRGKKRQKLSLRQKFEWWRIWAQLIQLIPEYPGGGQWAGVFLHTSTVAIMAYFDILMGIVTPLEAMAGVGTLGLLASLMVKFQEFSKRIEEHDRILIQYGAVIGFGCVSAILIEHIYAADNEVGVAIFTGAQMAVTGLVAYNHFSGGSRGVRKAISILVHFPVEIDRLLAPLEMQGAPDLADEIRVHLTNRWYSDVTKRGGLRDQALDYLWENARTEHKRIGITKKAWREEFNTGVDALKRGEAGPSGHNHEIEAAGELPLG